MPNMDFYGMFDFATGDTDTYKYSSQEWADYIDALNGTGVVKEYLNAFETTKSGFVATIKTGGCFINGRFGKTTSNKTITFDAVSSGTEVRSIVLQLSVSNRIITIENILGTTYIQNSTTYQLPIYTVTVTSSGIALTDVRSYVYPANLFQTDIAQLQTDINAKPSTLSDITGTLGISKGGTGATSASAARTNLGAAAASHTHNMSDITLGVVPITNGGTGANNAATALTNLGIIYSATQPTYQAGAIWLKPVDN